jgi:hypothetical protein
LKKILQGGKTSYVHGLAELIRKIDILPKAIYRCNAISIKSPVMLSTEIEESIPKFIWKHKSPQITKAAPSKRSSTESITIPDFKLYYKSMITKTE